MEQPAKGCSGEFIWIILTVLQVLCRISLSFQSPVASLQSPQLRIQHRFRISHRQPPLSSSSLKINRKSIIPAPYIPYFGGGIPSYDSKWYFKPDNDTETPQSVSGKNANTKTKFYIPRALLLPALPTRLTRLTTIECKLWQEGLGRISPLAPPAPRRQDCKSVRCKLRSVVNGLKNKK